MPGKCCVPNCRGNYDVKEKISVFKFPKDPETRKLWCSKISRANFKPTDRSVVCAKHFSPNFVLTIDTVTRPDGSILTVERERPKLRDGAYPSIFPNCPSYSLTEEPQTKRKKPEERRQEAEKRDETSFNDWLQADKIASFSDFSDTFKARMDDTWFYRHIKDLTIEQSSFWSFYQIKDSPNNRKPMLVSVVRVFADMHVEVYTENTVQVPDTLLKWLFGQHSPPVLKTWSQFDTLLSHFSGTSLQDMNIKQQVQGYIKEFHHLCSDKRIEEIDEKKGSLLQENIRIPTANAQTDSQMINQEIETTQTDQADANVPSLVMEIKQEINDDTSVEVNDTEDLKISASRISSCSLNVTGLETVPQTGLSEEVEKKYDKDEGSPCNQWYLANSSVDNRKDNMESFNSCQHSQLVIHNSLPERLSKPIKNTADRIEDMMEGIKSMSEQNGNIIKRSEDEKNPCIISNRKTTHSQNVSYKCDDNGLVITQLGHLKKDTRKYNEVKSLKCDICGKEFATTYSLKVHKSIHTGEKPYKCNICGVGYVENYKLKLHKRTHTGEKPYKCDVCCVGFIRNADLMVHKRTHTGEKPYICDICGVGYFHISRLTVHKRTHTGEKPYMCDVCGVGFIRNGDLKVHKRTHTGEKPYTCDVCGVGFIQNSKLKLHKRTHTGEKPYKCDVCGIEYSQSNNLKVHKRTHTGEKPYKCDVCGLDYNRSNNLKVHKRTHTGEKPYKCDVCGVIFTRISSMKLHKIIHTGDRPYKCDVCGIGFLENNKLTVHKRRHTGEKPYKCDVCGIGFIRNFDLKVHKRTHTGEKPYMCDVCGVGFIHSGHINVHKRIHTGEKPYKCDVCGVGFIRNGDLKVHKRTHTLEKPYKCDICGVGFIQNSKLKVHKGIHT